MISLTTRLTLASLLSLTVACGGKKAPTPTGSGQPAPVAGDATPTPPETTKAPAETAKAPAEPPPKDAETPPPEVVLGSDTAIVVIGDRLVAVDASTGAELTLTQARISNCRADPRAGGVWLELRSGADDETTNVSFFDLADRRSTLVAKGMSLPALAYADEVVDLPPGTDFEVAPVLVIDAERPRFMAQVGCDGDHMMGCWDMPDDDEGELSLNAEVSAEVRRIDALQLADAAPVKLAARRSADAKAKRVLAEAEPLPTDGSKIVALSDERCAFEPADCGAGVALPGGLSEVVVGNDRGDVYHEWSQLYDAKAGVFVDPSDPTKRSKTPWTDEYEPVASLPHMEIAASGRGWLLPERLVLAGGDATRSKAIGVACGWYGTAVTAGGWPRVFRRAWSRGLTKPSERPAMAPADAGVGWLIASGGPGETPGTWSGAVIACRDPGEGEVPCLATTGALSSAGVTTSLIAFGKGVVGKAKLAGHETVENAYGGKELTLSLAEVDGEAGAVVVVSAKPPVSLPRKADAKAGAAALAPVFAVWKAAGHDPSKIAVEASRVDLDGDGEDEVVGTFADFTDPDPYEATIGVSGLFVARGATLLHLQTNLEDLSDPEQGAPVLFAVRDLLEIDGTRGALVDTMAYEEGGRSLLTASGWEAPKLPAPPNP